MNKKLLFISSIPSHPVTAGNRTSMRNYVELLKKNGYEVYYFFITINVEQPDVIPMLEYWGENLYIYHPPFYKWQLRVMKYYRLLTRKNLVYNVDDWTPIGASGKLKKMCKKYHFEAVMINYIWLSKLLKGLTCKVKIIHTHDVYSFRNERLGTKWFSVTPEQEAKALNRADVSLAVQEDEGIFFRFLTKNKIVVTFCPFPFVMSEKSNIDNILFFSSNNIQNIKGISWWIDKVFVKIKQKYPTTSLLIGGSICGSIQKYKFVDGIKILGEFEKVEEFYKLGEIVINPIYSGTGLKIKTIEALAFNKILVLHPHNIIGLPFKNDIPVFLAENEDENIKNIGKIFENPSHIEAYKKRIYEYMVKYNNLIEDRINPLLNSD